MPDHDLPGGAIKGRPLHFFWLADCSGSMSGEKIEMLNYAIRAALPAMRQEAAQNPTAEVLVRVIKFSDAAGWHVSKPTPVESFDWIDLTAGGQTAMGDALRLVSEQLQERLMPSRGLPPVLVLISDGLPTDNFGAQLGHLLGLPWAAKAVRVAIAIGKDADRDVLQQFVHNPEIPVLEVTNPQTLVQYIRWVSTDVLRAASRPPSQPGQLQRSQIGAQPQGNVPVGQPPKPINVESVW